ncbi:MAG: hypothetical protein M5R36_09185 [Deltaproteobacteria bacterium]|nr:hypothetical protein [Deltaproteobacteria bacterium]
MTVGGSGVFTAAIFAVALSLGFAIFHLRDQQAPDHRPIAALALVVVITVSSAWVKLESVQELLDLGTYVHGLRSRAAYADLRTEGSFYAGAGQFLTSALTVVDRTMEYNQAGRPMEDEYSYLGVPWHVFPMFFVGAAILRRRFFPWLLAGAFMLVLCFGPNFPLDLYRVVIWPFEPLRRISQFYKYGNYFLMLVMILPAGAVIDWLDEHRPTHARAVTRFLFAALVPFALWHGSLFATLFSVEPSEAKQGRFRQIRSAYTPRVAPSLVEHRELARLPRFIEIDNLRRGIGTIDWYADILSPGKSRAPVPSRSENGGGIRKSQLEGPRLCRVGNRDRQENRGARQPPSRSPSKRTAPRRSSSIKTSTGHGRPTSARSSIEKASSRSSFRRPTRGRMVLDFVPKDFYASLTISLGSVALWLLLWASLKRRRGAG